MHGKLWGIVVNCVFLQLEMYNKVWDMQFIGNVEAKMDAKGRVFFPASFRKLLQAEGRLIMRKDIYQDCLVLYPEDEQYGYVDQQLSSGGKRRDYHDERNRTGGCTRFQGF